MPELPETLELMDIYNWAVGKLKTGVGVEVLHAEIEAANRFVEGMKQRPIFSGNHPENPHASTD